MKLYNSSRSVSAGDRATTPIRGVGICQTSSNR